MLPPFPPTPTVPGDPRAPAPDAAEELRFWTETLRRHRETWERKASLRHAYEPWLQALAARVGGRRPLVEIGSGGGILRGALPHALLTDLAPVPWIHLRADAAALPFRTASCGALVLVDVLHHLPRPEAFFREAERSLAPGGRLVLLEPYVSPFSRPIYRFLHPEGLPSPGDPWRHRVSGGENGLPFSDQNACKEIFWKRRDAFERTFRGLRVVDRTRTGFLGYCLSGGFSGPSLWPRPLWGPVDLLDRIAIASLPGLLAMRTLVTLERAPAGADPTPRDG